MLEEGLLFADRYKFIKLLGRGGFSEVWLAEDSLTSVQIAVKVYAPGSGLDDAGIKLFTQEFSLVFDMNHTNLLRPTHFDCWNRMPYLILPYCKNGSAFGYLTQEKRISEDECWNLLHDVAAGLAYLHEKVPPVIHQDIKPDNILISDEGHYMITDFGISSRVRSTIRNGMAQEQSGGTLAYMGPERFSATPKPIMASDVWSLGAMMYELMTGGNPPFGNHGGVLQKNGADIPVIEEDFSQELKNIVYNCLAKDTWERLSARNIEEKAYNKIHGIVLPSEQHKDFVEEHSEETQSVKEQETVKEHETETAKELETEKDVVSNIEVESIDNEQPVANSLQKSDNNEKIKSKNKKLIYGGIVLVVLVILISIITCSGGSSTNEEMVDEMGFTPKVNYDSLALIKINEARTICEETDSFLISHEEDKYDEKHAKVEESYINAYMLLQEALVNKDSLSADVATDALQQKIGVTNALLGIYNDFTGTAKFLREQGIDAVAFEKRAENIKPYIENLITNSENESGN